MKPVVELLRSGFVPILHGDCVLDDVQGCAILSGDKIIEVNDSLQSQSISSMHSPRHLSGSSIFSSVRCKLHGGAIHLYKSPGNVGPQNSVQIPHLTIVLFIITLKVIVTSKEIKFEMVSLNIITSKNRK